MTLDDELNELDAAITRLDERRAFIINQLNDLKRLRATEPSLGSGKVLPFPSGSRVRVETYIDIPEIWQ